MESSSGVGEVHWSARAKLEERETKAEKKETHRRLRPERLMILFVPLLL
jgi:hypothetical protein